MVIVYKKWKKYNEIQLTKKNELEQSKNDKSLTLPCIEYIFHEDNCIPGKPHEQVIIATDSPQNVISCLLNISWYNKES